jgi:hypothetical protein
VSLTEDGRPVCGSCGATPRRRQVLVVDSGGDSRFDGFGCRPLTVEEYTARARAAGWKIGALPDGVHDAMCAACARPDPVLARLCRDLRRELQQPLDLGGDP